MKCCDQLTHLSANSLVSFSCFFCVSATCETSSDNDPSSAVVVRIYSGAPYGVVICNVTAHLFPVGHLPHADRRRVAVTGIDAGRFRLTGGGELLAVGEHPTLSGQIGDEYVVNVTSLVERREPTARTQARTFQLRVLVSRENMWPPRFIRTSPLPTEGVDGSYSADAYRYDVGGTPLRMRQAICVFDDDVDDYNRVVTFSLNHRRGRRARRRQLADHKAPYLSIDPVTGQLSSGRVFRAAPGGIIRTSIVAVNSVSSPTLSSSVEVTVYVCDVPGESSTTHAYGSVLLCLLQL